MKKPKPGEHISRSISFILTFLMVFPFFGQEHKITNQRQANTIRIYIGGHTIGEAKASFTEYISEKGFPVKVADSVDHQKSNYQNDKRNQINVVQLEENLSLLDNQSPGDTMVSSIVQLNNTMWGQFTAYIKYIVEKVDEDEISITITGFVSSNSFGMGILNERMQKGGKDANWAQKDLFKRIEKHLSEYNGVNKLTYLKE